MSETLTRGIRVKISCQFMPEPSSPTQKMWIFAYQVEIANEGDETVQLLNRHWLITHGDGRVEEVRGAGVIGKQPHIHPGERHRYSSMCPLTTPVGSMRGSYQMLSESGERFNATIDPFVLATPHALN